MKPILAIFILNLALIQGLNLRGGLKDLLKGQNQRPQPPSSLAGAFGEGGLPDITNFFGLADGGLNFDTSTFDRTDIASFLPPPPEGVFTGDIEVLKEKVNNLFTGDISDNEEETLLKDVFDKVNYCMEKRIKEGNHKGIFEGNYDEPDSNNTIDIEIEGCLGEEVKTALKAINEKADIECQDTVGMEICTPELLQSDNPSCRPKICNAEAGDRLICSSKTVQNDQSHLYGTVTSLLASQGKGGMADRFDIEEMLGEVGLSINDVDSVKKIAEGLGSQVDSATLERVSEVIMDRIKSECAQNAPSNKVEICNREEMEIIQRIQGKFKLIKDSCKRYTDAICNPNQLEEFQTIVKEVKTQVQNGTFSPDAIQMKLTPPACCPIELLNENLRANWEENEEAVIPCCRPSICNIENPSDLSRFLAANRDDNENEGPKFAIGLENAFNINQLKKKMQILANKTDLNINIDNLESELQRDGSLDENYSETSKIFRALRTECEERAPVDGQVCSKSTLKKMDIVSKVKQFKKMCKAPREDEVTIQPVGEVTIQPINTATTNDQPMRLQACTQEHMTILMDKGQMLLNKLNEIDTQGLGEVPSLNKTNIPRCRPSIDFCDIVKNITNRESGEFCRPSVCDIEDVDGFTAFLRKKIAEGREPTTQKEKRERIPFKKATFLLRRCFEDDIQSAEVREFGESAGLNNFENNILAGLCNPGRTEDQSVSTSEADVLKKVMMSAKESDCSDTNSADEPCSDSTINIVNFVNKIQSKVCLDENKPVCTDETQEVAVTLEVEEKLNEGIELESGLTTTALTNANEQACAAGGLRGTCGSTSGSPIEPVVEIPEVQCRPTKICESVETEFENVAFYDREAKCRFRFCDIDIEKDAAKFFKKAMMRVRNGDHKKKGCNSIGSGGDTLGVGILSTVSGGGGKNKDKTQLLNQANNNYDKDAAKEAVKAEIDRKKEEIKQRRSQVYKWFAKTADEECSPNLLPTECTRSELGDPSKRCIKLGKDTLDSLCFNTDVNEYVSVCYLKKNNQGEEVWREKTLRCRLKAVPIDD